MTEPDNIIKWWLFPITFIHENIASKLIKYFLVPLAIGYIILTVAPVAVISFLNAMIFMAIHIDEFMDL